MKFIPDSHARLWAISVFVFIAIFICIICNMAIEHEITWLVYPVCSLIFAWGVFAPLIYRGKNGLLLSLGLLSALILPYLLILEQWTNTTGWFIPIAFPIATFSVVLIWAAYFLLKTIKNIWNAFALITAIAGILSFIIYLTIQALIDFVMFPWGLISALSACGLAFLLYIAGRIRTEVVTNNNL